MDLLDALSPTPIELEAAVRGFRDQVRSASALSLPLVIQGGGSKRFLGEAVQGEILDTRHWCGAVRYQASERVITVRCGTPVAALEAALAQQGQCLAFEPPRHSEHATIGGMVAAGLSGPARLSRGAVRDHVLGVTVMNGQGEVLRFGGEVMKNVAGYDLSRMMVGAMGTLGLLLDISLKLTPLPVATATMRLTLDAAPALERGARWLSQALPIDATAWWQGQLVLRLAGAQAAVTHAMDFLISEHLAEGIDADLADAFWEDLRHQRDAFFVEARQSVAQGQRLWRLSLPPLTPPLPLPGDLLMEWGGAQRWLLSPADAAQVRQAVAAAGGHAMVWAGDPSCGVFSPLQSPLDRIHRDIKRRFDPASIFNPGRMYPGL